MNFESLESRRLLSASPGVEQNGVVLFVRGTAYTDTITVLQSPDDGSVFARLNEDAKLYTGVKLVIVDAGGDIDTVSVDVVDLHAIVRSGAGDDFVQFVAAGTARALVDTGSGRDTVGIDAGGGSKVTGFADAGDDVISLRVRDADSTIVFHAGSGADEAFLENLGGTLVYHGGAGTDTAVVLEGSDSVCLYGLEPIAFTT